MFTEIIFAIPPKIHFLFAKTQRNPRNIAVMNSAKYDEKIKKFFFTNVTFLTFELALIQYILIGFDDRLVIYT